MAVALDEATRKLLDARNFATVATLNPDGGPANSTLVITQQIFSTAFRDGRFGLACAMGVVLALVTFAFTGLVFGAGRIVRKVRGS